MSSPPARPKASAGQGGAGASGAGTGASAGKRGGAGGSAATAGSGTTSGGTGNGSGGTGARNNGSGGTGNEDMGGAGAGAGEDAGGAAGSADTGGSGGSGHGSGGTGGSGAKGGSSGKGGSGGSAGSAHAGASGSGGAAGSSGSGGTSGGSGVGGGSGSGGTGTCGALGQACCSSNACGTNLTCLSGASCSCVAGLYGRYVVRGDGHVLLENDDGSETTILDAGSLTPLGHAIAASEGAVHGCALLDDHTVKCWRTTAAGNGAGELGSGTADSSGATFQATPVLSAPNTPLAGVVALSTNGSAAYNTCAVTSDGKVYCWGDATWLTNNGVRLSNAFATPITTNGVTTFTGALAVSLNFSYACALVAGSTSHEVWCWGENNHAQLGNGNTTKQQYPVRALGLTNPTKITTFGSEEYASAVCALDGGQVRCWGSNATGQLGNNAPTSTPVSTPQTVVLNDGTTALTGIVDVDGGYDDNVRAHACALTQTGTVLCWGNGFNNYATTYGVSNVADFGNADYGGVKFLSSDGSYHGPTVHAPKCGSL